MVDVGTVWVDWNEDVDDLLCRGTEHARGPARLPRFTNVHLLPPPADHHRRGASSPPQGGAVVIPFSATGAMARPGR